MGRDSHVDDPRGVFDASAARYVEFAGTELGPATEHAVDLSTLAAFVELVRAGGRGTVADLGCGPGRAAAHLSRHDLEVVGVDVSSELLVLGREAHPAVPFVEGRIDELPFADSSLVGAVAWYSVIFTPPSLLPALVTELARVVAPDGPVLLAFQSGSGEAAVTTDAQSTGISLTSYRHDVEEVCTRLEDAGFSRHATTVRPASLTHESTDQAFVIARRRRTPDG